MSEWRSACFLGDEITLKPCAFFRITHLSSMGTILSRPKGLKLSKYWVWFHDRTCVFGEEVSFLPKVVRAFEYFCEFLHNEEMGADGVQSDVSRSWHFWVGLGIRKLGKLWNWETGKSDFLQLLYISSHLGSLEPHQWIFSSNILTSQCE